MNSRQLVPLYVPLRLVGQSAVTAYADGKRISYRDWEFPQTVTRAVGIGASGIVYAMPVGQKPYVAVIAWGEKWAGQAVVQFPTDTRARIR
jgi:hypothetical protein